MASIVANIFSTYKLTDEEALQGSALTVTQMQVLHNLRTIQAEEKLALIFDTKNPEKYIQDSAYAAGYIAAISDILAASEVSIDILNHEEDGSDA